MALVLKVLSGIPDEPSVGSSANTGNTKDQHPLVTAAKKAFWQLKPPLPSYHGTYNINIVLRFIENMRQNETLTLKQLSENSFSGGVLDFF